MTRLVQPDDLYGDLKSVGERLRRLEHLGGLSGAPILVGAAGAPAFSTNWQNFGGFHTAVRFWKDANGIIHVEGLCIKTTTLTPPETIFNLPDGYRPPGIHVFSALNNNSAGRVDIHPGGNVNIEIAPVTTANAYVSLAGISFLDR